MPPTDTRTRLLETALNLIWNSNYSSVGVNEICKQAEITKGSFYYHFESKAELFCETAEFYWDSIRQDLDAILSPINTPLEQLEAWIALIMANKIGDDIDNMPGCAFFNAGSQGSCGDESVQQTTLKMLTRGAKYNVALLRNLEAGGFIEPLTDIDQVSRLMQQFIHGFISYVQLTRNLENARRDLPAAIYRIVGLKPEYVKAR